MESTRNAEAELREATEAAGGELVVEQGGRTLGPIAMSTPTRYVDAKCPHCGGESWWHHFGDTLARCDGCGAEIDVADLQPPDESLPRRLPG
jgi:ribosomal protein S27E